MFGVSYAVQRALAKKAGRDQALAEELWASGNHDARILATLVADPDAISAEMIDDWARELDNYVLMDAFSAIVAETPQAASHALRWKDAAKEMVGAAGWNVIAALAMRSDAFDDAALESFLDTIEADIHKRGNRVRHAMNGALIAIGMRNAELEKRAVAVARAIGPVDVDHGETGCKTPDAASYIVKSRERSRKNTATRQPKPAKQASKRR
jgi:3-methyladenine DNA glycosylase AlkD